MKKDLLVKKLMDNTVTFENVKKILISELKDDRVECIGQLENLKLHDVSYYICEKLDKIDDLTQSEYCDIYSHIFNLFCEDNYNAFINYEEENNTKRKYLGHTSRFYIDTDYYDGIINYYYASDFRSEYDIEKKKSMLLDEFLYSVLNTDEVYIEEEFMNEQDFNYMINEYKDFLDTIEEIYDVYEYIKDFKENQVQYFEDWYENFYKEVYGDLLNGEIEK